MALEDIVKGKAWWGSSSPRSASMRDRASMASLLGAATGTGSPASSLPGGLSLSYLHGNHSVVNRSPGGSSKSGNAGTSSTGFFNSGPPALGYGGAAVSEVDRAAPTPMEGGVSSAGSFGFYSGFNGDAVGTSIPVAGASLHAASTSTTPTSNQAVEKIKDALPQDHSFALVMQHNRWQTWQAKLSRLYSAARLDMVDGILQAVQHPY